MRGVTHIDSNKMDLSVAVLACLGSRHIDDLAGPPLDDYVTAKRKGQADLLLRGYGILLAQSRALKLNEQE